MERYNEYKDSGVQWLGEIPSHWEVVRLKSVIKDSQSGVWGEDPKHDGSDTLCLRVADFNYNNGYLKEDNLTYRNYGKELSSNKQLQMRDLLLEKSGGGDLYPVGRVVRYNFNGIVATCSNFIQKLTPRDNVDSDFIYYLFRTMYYLKVNGLYYNQTTGIQNLKVKEYLSQTVFLPPLSEQQAIANYLDTATAKIDEAIAQQQKMIDLLNERKQIIINNAVTKGLNPDAPMKDSGVDWIGEIPEHWEVMKLKHVTSKIGSGSTPRGGAEVYQDSGIMFLRSQNVYNDGLKLDDVAHIVDGVHQKMKGTQVKYNDILYNITGGSIGRCCCYDREDEANVNQHVSIVRPKGIIAKYLMYNLQSDNAQRQLRETLKGGNREGLAAVTFKEFLILTCPKEEQNQIVSHIERMFVNIDRAISNATKQISLLQERKQIIINDVVTGKVKVS